MHRSKNQNIVQLWHPVDISFVLSPRLEHVSITLRSFVENEASFVFGDRWLNWMHYLHSEYHGESCGFNPPGGSITRGQSNHGRIVSVILFAFSHLKVIAGWRFKTFMLDKTSYSETETLRSRTCRNSCKELWLRRQWYYWYKSSYIVCSEGKM